MSKRRTGAVLLVSLLAAAGVCAQEIPKRKPGLWEMSMDMQGGMQGMKSQQCVDATSDADTQRRALSGEDREPGTRCTHAAPRRVSGGIEMEADCTSPQGKSHVASRMTGDMQSSYAVDSVVRFDPPRHGMAEMRMSMKGRYAGACPAGMKAGEMRTSGMPMPAAPGARPGMPGGIDPSQLQNMTPAQRQQMIEQLKKMRPPAQ